MAKGMVARGAVCVLVPIRTLGLRELEVDYGEISESEAIGDPQLAMLQAERSCGPNWSLSGNSSVDLQLADKGRGECQCNTAMKKERCLKLSRLIGGSSTVLAQPALP